MICHLLSHTHSVQRTTAGERLFIDKTIKGTCLACPAPMSAKHHKCNSASNPEGGRCCGGVVGMVTRMYGKRGLLIWQKRPIDMAKEAY